MGAAVQAINLTKRFGELTAVDQVNFAVDSEEILGLLERFRKRNLKSRLAKRPEQI